MYLPPPFRVDDDIALNDAAEVGFGPLVVVDGDAPVSTPMPFLVARNDASTGAGHDGETGTGGGARIIVGKRKLSQNKPAADRDGAIALLHHDGHARLANSMGVGSNAAPPVNRT